MGEEKESDMAARLFPAGGGCSIALTKRVMVVGRAHDCDIRVNNPVVSNHHCMLVFDGNSWVVQDLKSRNGTMINSIPVTKHAIKSGETLVVAAKFRFVIEYVVAKERDRFAAMSEGEDHHDELPPDRNYAEYGPATKRLEPHDKDVWSTFE
jgi:pSer/pThr/pTyr-binding forkhead associated (FHA) protein